MKKSLFLGLGLFLLLVSSFSGQLFATITQDMQGMAKALEDIYPLVFRNGPINDSERDLIKSRLEIIESTLINNKDHFRALSVPYAVNYELLTSHLKEAKDVFATAKSSGTISYGKGLIKAIPIACSNCHTSDARKARESINNLNISVFDSALEYADFLFTSRQYEKALAEYRSFISSSKAQGSQILHAFKRSLLSSLMLKQNPRTMIEFIEDYLKKNRPNLFVKDRLQEWLAGMRKLDLRPEYLDMGADWKKISDYIKDKIVPLQKGDGQVELLGTEEVYLMNLVGNLGRYLNFNPAKETLAESLYWFALAERSLYDNMFFSLSDLLLKACVQNYGDQPYARKCMKEYEDQVIFAYSGSRGTELPDDVREELKSLREYLGSPETIKKTK